MSIAAVTGAIGFVGSNLVRFLLRRGMAVRALVRKTADVSNLDGLSVDICKGELEQPAALDALLRDCDVCFHVAAALPGAGRVDLYRANVDGTRAVLTAASEAGCSAIVHATTIGTLCGSPGAPARETDRRLRPGATDYVRSKYLSEDIALELASKGAPIRVAHLAAPIGARDRSPTVTGRRILDVLDGKVPEWIPGPINCVYVGDVVEGLLLAAIDGSPGERYLFGNRRGNLTRAQFIRLVQHAAGIPTPAAIHRLAIRDWLRFARKRRTAASLACNPEWTINRLAYPQTPLERAFAEAVAWYARHRHGVSGLEDGLRFGTRMS
jgi:dihydroflavonol-4-reductase